MTRGAIDIMIEQPANEVVNEFAGAFEAELAELAATLVRLQLGHSDRSFAIVKSSKTLSFVAKLSPTLERRDDGRDYSELRVVAFGIGDGIPLTMVYTDRTEWL